MKRGGGGWTELYGEKLAGAKKGGGSNFVKNKKRKRVI